MRKVTFYTTIDRHGKIDPIHAKNLQKLLKKNANSNMDITLSKPKRSDRQNRYYWGVVMSMIVNHYEDAGSKIDPDALHEDFLHEFSKKTVRKHTVTGKLITVPDRSRNMPKPEFFDYVEKIRAWAMTELNLDIPEPKEII